MVTNKVILITGAASGIGYGLFKDLQSRNKVYCLDKIDRENIHFLCDVSNAKDVENLMKSLKGIDVLINAAGIMPFEESEQVMSTNFFGIVNMMRFCPMQKGGVIINIASISGIQADTDVPIYAASKAAVISYTKAMAKKLAPDVRVNCVSPGFFRTNLVEGETPQELISQVPMQREAYIDELYELIPCIINSTYMTGSNVVIDGGMVL